MKKIFLSVLSVLWLLTACEQTHQLPVQNDVVEVYLIKSYQTVDSTQQIIDSTIVLETQPLISNEKIVGYDSTEKAFIVTEATKQSLMSYLKGFYVKPFAVTVNSEIIYWGYFWPVYMSTPCNWITCDPTFYFSDSTEIPMELAYPTNEYSLLDNDPRNDDQLIQVFSKAGKIK